MMPNVPWKRNGPLTFLFTIVSFAACLQKVSSGGIVEVYLQNFTNGNTQGLLTSGVCCDKIGIGFLSTCELNGGCDTYFVVCIDQTTNTGLDDLTTCTFGYTSTELTADTASIVFGNTIGGGLLTTPTPNPLTFSFTSWPNQVLVKVQAWDKDLGLPSEKIDFLMSNPLSITPAGAIAPWTDVTLQNRTTMNLRVRVSCGLNYYGAQCNVLCLPGWQYTCGSDGIKQCSAGWDGANCDQPASGGDVQTTDGGGDQTTDGGGDQTTVDGAVQVTDGVVKQVRSGGIAEVYLQSFTNQNAQLASGVCCDKIGVGFLSTCEPIDGGCDTYFVVCIDQTTNTGLDDLTTCTYGYKTTELTADTASIVFGNTIGAGLLTTSTPNPLTFNFTSWPSQVLIKVQAWDSDIGFSPEKIDFLVSNPLSITPAGAIATWTDVTLQNRTTMNLRVRVRARCELNYYGAQCDVLCLPGLLYTCGSDGEKQCSPGWDGANCDQLASAVGGDQPTDGGGDQTTVAGAVQVTEGVVQQVSSGGIVEVYLQNFTNGNTQGLLTSGVCCDKIGIGFLSTCELNGGCDTYFVVCIDQTTNTGLDDLTTCTYGYKTTELTADTASMVFGNTIGGGLLTTSTPNPLTFNFASWPSQVLVKVQAWDSDIGFSPEKIDFLVSNPLSITPAGAIATWTDVTLQNRTTMNLRVRVRVRCGLNYYGAQCNVLCLPGLQYTCDSDGVKQCSPGWAGANCDKPASAGGGAQPTVGVVEQVTTADCGGCANNGQCIGGSCSCATGYTGAKCDQIAALCQVNLCQNGGSCQQSGVVTSCSCAAGWTGPRCERDIDECSNNVCRNSGACQNTNGGFVCTCLPGWTGQLCDVNINDYSSSSPDGTEKSRVLKFGQKLTKEQIWFILYSISRRATALDAGQSTSTAFVYYQVIYYYDKSSGVEQTLLLYRVTRGGQAITSHHFYSGIESDVSSQSSQSSLTFSSGGDEKDFESEIDAAAAGQTGEMPMSELRRRLDVGAIIVIAFIIGGLIIGALVIFICRQRKQKWEIDSQTMDPIQTLEIKEVTTEACGGISGPDDDNRVNSAQLTIDCGETQQTTSPNIYVITKHKHGHHHHHHHPSRSGSSSSSSSSGSRSIYDQIREGR